MPTRPRLLDAFCGVGGAGEGYRRAGFAVVGVDINPQPRYYSGKFVQGDAVEFINEHGHQFDFIHASPPCQSQTALTKGTNKGREYPNLIPATREALHKTGRPWVIENVVGAAVRPDVILCGAMFSLGVIRHRWFEFGWTPVPQPEHIKHRGRVAGWRHGEWFDGPYFAVYGDGGGKGTVFQWQQAMDIGWTRVRKELAEAIPPAYTEYIGRELLARPLLAETGSQWVDVLSPATMHGPGSTHAVRLEAVSPVPRRRRK